MFITLTDPVETKQTIFSIVFFYRPPHIQVSQLTSFIDYFSTTLAQFDASNETTFVCGDYNINLLLINENIHCSSFFECILSSGYLPSITLPTRIYDNSTLIDNIIYNRQPNLIFAGILENRISDHQAILINPVHRPPPSKSKYITVYSNSDASKEKFRTYINSLNLYATLDTNIDSDPNINYEIIESVITNVMDIHLSKKSCDI